VDASEARGIGRVRKFVRVSEVGVPPPRRPRPFSPSRERRQLVRTRDPGLDQSLDRADDLGRSEIRFKRRDATTPSSCPLGDQNAWTADVRRVKRDRTKPCKVSSVLRWAGGVVLGTQPSREQIRLSGNGWVVSPARDATHRARKSGSCNRM
jgi:hypothetical protein